jgi:hypothetical protein
MANDNCRDCKRCTESGLKRLVAGPGRALASPISAPARMMKKKCRVCGHPLNWHEKLDGRFAD